MGARTLLPLLLLTCIVGPASGQERDPDSRITWPDGAEVAVSLTFDDARTSQVDVGLDLFERYGAHVTFFVVPGAVEQRLEGWRRARDDGHEIGNHTVNHPCSGNFTWARDRALETYTLEKMREELAAANRRLDELLGVTPEVFAYPCGQTFVGRGTETQSYVPLVAEAFLSGRGWLDEVPNDPAYVDMAQLTGIEMDGKSFDEIRPLVEQAREDSLWVVLGGHEIGEGGNQTTRTDMLERLLLYVSDPSNRVWLAPVGTAAAHVMEQRRSAR